MSSDTLLVPEGNYIGGAWRAANAGGVLSVEDPATGEQLAQIPASDASDIDVAVETARSASRAWKAPGTEPSGADAVAARDGHPGFGGATRVHGDTRQRQADRGGP